MLAVPWVRSNKGKLMTMRIAASRAQPLALGLSIFCGMLFGILSCKGEAPEEKVDAPAAPAAPAAAAAGPTCVGAIAAGTPETIEIGGNKWVLNGSTLSAKAVGNGSIRIGAVTDIKENTPENLENLEEFVAWFKKEKVDVIVVAGDTGMDKMQIEAALGVLAKVSVPVLNIIGNRESLKEYDQAMASVRKQHKNVFDLNSVRRVDTGAVDIISLPGYFNENYIHADDGCVYTSADVDGLSALVKASDSPILLVSHGGPKQQGTDAIDRTAEGENVGDPNIAKALAAHKIPFGIFGNIHEAGGRATSIDGTKILDEGKDYDSLYLNPGPADGVRWVMNDKSESIGMAGILTVKGNKARYEIHRIGADKGGKGKGKGKKK